MLYDPEQFEPLIDEPWVPARVEDAIAGIVADAEAAFDLDKLWAAEEWDGWEEASPLKNLYVGAAGVIWALDALRRRGHGTQERRSRAPPRSSSLSLSPPSREWAGRPHTARRWTGSCGRW